jgi:hypothetical protein
MRAAERYLESTVQDQLHLGSLFSENVSFSGAREMLFKRSIESHHPPVMRQSPRINKGGRKRKVRWLHVASSESWSRKQDAVQPLRCER